jgi:heptosyltransferase-2
MNLAVFLPNWIGDVVMATPAVRALRQRYPAARLSAVCRPYVAGVVDGLPWFDDIIPLDMRGPWRQRWPAVGWRLRQMDVDLAVLFPNSFHSALVAWLGRCRRRIGFRRYARGLLLTEALEPARDPCGRLVPSPILDDYNMLAQRGGCWWPGYRMELATTPVAEEAADRVYDKFQLYDQEVVCLNPGAAFGAAKHWPAESFARLTRALVEQRGCRVLVLCGPSERSMARQIAAQADMPQVASLAEEPLSLGLTKALVRRCALLVTTDSGPRHFAAAFQRPVVSLFGPTHIAWTDTHYAAEIALQERVPCGPCQQRVCHLDHACMTRLAPERVLHAAQQLLERGVPERKAS